jgi:hypothetical protein
MLVTNSGNFRRWQRGISFQLVIPVQEHGFDARLKAVGCDKQRAGTPNHNMVCLRCRWSHPTNSQNGQP